MAFLQSAFLFGLAIVAIPLALHLFMRRRLKSLPFPALMLLTGSSRKSMRTLTPRQWLVMLLRMAALASIVAAASQPVIRGLSLPLPGAASSTTVHVILDNSPGMNAKHNGVSLFELAKAAAEKIVAVSSREDDVSLELACETPSGPLPRDPAALSDSIRKSSTSYCSPDLGLIINRAVRSMRDVRSVEKKIVVLSDLRRNVFIAPPLDPAKSDPDIIFVNLSQGLKVNDLSIAEIETPLYPSPGEEMEICYRLKGDAQAGAALNVEMFIDADKRGEQSVLMDEDGDAAGCFSVTLGESGHAAGRIAARGDGLPDDISKRFIISAREKMKLALVASKESMRDPESGAFYLFRGLRAATGAGGGARSIELSTLSPDGVDARALSDFDAVIVFDPSGLNPKGLAALADFVSSGGGAILTSSKSISANQAVARALFSNSISISERAGASGSENAFLTVGDVDSAHPIFSALSGNVFAAFRETRFNPHCAVDAVNPETSSPAAFSDGSPLIVERAAQGGGGAVFFATDLSPASTNFPLKTAFVPILLLAAKHLTDSSQASEYEFIYGRRARIRADAAGASELTVLNLESGGKFTFTEIERGGGIYSPESGAPLPPGSYKALHPDDDLALAVFVINPDDFYKASRPLPLDDLLKTYKSWKAKSLHASSFSGSNFPGDIFSDKGAALWFPLLFLSAGFLLIETFVVNKR
ncbi:MAG: hypothetical protein BWY28_00002 [bacterium ADurb.Bin236]|nr:MAG: hypothetical protein BWY28_00002 [bacterium ADurb.Bin236]HPN93132.1 BatA domain-containing protein [bacterium]